jgi:hypothetical protein
MAYELVSTLSWNVLGTFDEATKAQEAVSASLTDGGASPHDLLVNVLDESGNVVEEIHDADLAAWAGVQTHA